MKHTDFLANSHENSFAYWNGMFVCCQSLCKRCASDSFVICSYWFSTFDFLYCLIPMCHSFTRPDGSYRHKLATFTRRLVSPTGSFHPTCTGSYARTSSSSSFGAISRCSCHCTDSRHEVWGHGCQVPRTKQCQRHGCQVPGQGKWLAQESDEEGEKETNTVEGDEGDEGGEGGCKTEPSAGETSQHLVLFRIQKKSPLASSLWLSDYLHKHPRQRVEDQACTWPTRREED